MPGAKLLLGQLNVELLLDLAWALRVEMLFYLGIAVLILLARHFHSIHLWIATASLVSLGLWALFPAIVCGNVAQFGPLFVLGMAGYLALVQNDRRISVASGALALAALALSLILIASGSQFDESGFQRNLGGQALLFLTGTVIFFLLARMRGLSANFLARDNYLGHLRYPLYLMHAPVLLGATHLGLERSLLSLTLVLVACLGAAVLTWHGFEARFDALRSKVRGQRLDPPPS